MCVVVKAADGFVEMVVFAVVAGEVVGLNEAGDSVAYGEPFAGVAEQGFLAVFSDYMQRVAGKGALQQGNSFRVVSPALVFARALDCPDA